MVFYSLLLRRRLLLVNITLLELLSIWRVVDLLLVENLRFCYALPYITT